MDFEFYFEDQLKKHPSMQFQDALKLCYQAAFGAEHLLSNEDRARAYLAAEFDSVLPTSEPLFEMISEEMARVNLGAWKRENRDLESLFNVFKDSAFVKVGAKEDFLLYLQTAQGVMSCSLPDFDLEKWCDFLEKYKEAGMPAIHHSAQYRETEKPSYRIVKKSLLEEIL